MTIEEIQDKINLINNEMEDIIDNMPEGKKKEKAKLSVEIMNNITESTKKIAEAINESPPNIHKVKAISQEAAERQNQLNHAYNIYKHPKGGY